MDFSDEQVKQFEENMRYMENLTKVYSWDSCNQILAYLAIFGKMKANEISKFVGLEGDKSVYKSLKRLLDADLIAKEFDDPSSQRNASYFTTRNELNDPEFSPEFISYLIKHNKYNLISDYLTTANQASMGFLQVMTDLMETKIKESKSPELGSRYVSNTMFIEALLSIEDPKPFLSDFHQFLKTHLPDYKVSRNNPSGGIDYPAALYIAFVPLSEPDTD